MAQPTTLPFGTALALAQRTLSAPLEAVLDAEGVSMTEWFTLNALGLRGPASLDALAGLLVTNGLDRVASENLISGLRRAGLVDGHDMLVSLTDAGTARYTDLRDRIGDVTTQIFARFDPTRVEQARAFLQEVAGIDPVELTEQVVGGRQ